MIFIRQNDIIKSNRFSEMSFVFILTLGESDPFFNLSAEEYFLCEKDEDFSCSGKTSRAL